MWIDILFLLFFLTQIIVLSYYCPLLLKRSVDYILNNYPPETHSLLYPKGVAKAKQWKRIFIAMHVCIMLVSLVVYGLVTAALINGNPAQVKLGYIPLLIFMLHMIPYIYLSVSSIIGLKHMRSANKKTLRSAALRPRTLFTFVSPLRLFSAIGAFLLNIVLTLHFNQYNFDEKSLFTLGGMVLSHSIFFVVAYFGIYGKNPNPHQSSEDRFNDVYRTLDIIIKTALLVNLYIILVQSVKYYSLEHWTGVINCTYCLLIGYLSRYSPENLKGKDFSVYKTPSQSANTALEQHT